MHDHLNWKQTQICAKEQGSLIVFQFTQVPCTDCVYLQRPDDRPAALFFSFCLPDGHQKAEHTAKSQGQIYPRKQTILWNWPKMLSHDANSIRPSSQLFSLRSRDLVGNPLSQPLSPEIWQCRRLSLCTVQPIVERNAAECAKGFHPLHSWCCSD